MIQKNREEQMAFLESLRMTEVKEEFKESVRSLKPQKPKKIKVPKAVQSQEGPSRKSLRLAKKHIDICEEGMAARAVAEAEKELEPSELSEYEKMIQKNREEQMAFLESLRMTEVKEEFKESVRSLKPQKPKKIKVPKAVQSQEGPSRKSLRLAKKHIDICEEGMAARAVAEAEKELEPSELSEYEKMIHKNREEQMAFLESLRMTEVKEEFKESVRSLKPQKPKKIKVPKAVQSQEGPSRKSLRLAKKHIDICEEGMAARAVAEAEKELEPSELSEYEKMIQKNREEQMAFLESLRMTEYFVMHPFASMGNVK
ncbi:hypothetical protein TNCT_347591 [Trichonephila clavata]|uniref:Uncharacterized protein n=1 Tax=Trichonephila clavata TaxID=2740835 RepID=A0A8X6I1X0_TRICU|nr:hypothetical protein TNCT_347591 [Trichonephila clavata]